MGKGFSHPLEVISHNWLSQIILAGRLVPSAAEAQEQGEGCPRLISLLLVGSQPVRPLWGQGCTLRRGASRSRASPAAGGAAALRASRISGVGPRCRRGRLARVPRSLPAPPGGEGQRAAGWGPSEPGRGRTSLSPTDPSRSPGPAPCPNPVPAPRTRASRGQPLRGDGPAEPPRPGRDTDRASHCEAKEKMEKVLPWQLEAVGASWRAGGGRAACLPARRRYSPRLRVFLSNNNVIRIIHPRIPVTEESQKAAAAAAGGSAAPGQ